MAIAFGTTLAGLLALAMSSSASARNVYVTNYESHTVSVLDATSNQVVGSPIQIGPETGPYTIAITPDGRTAYAVNYTSGTLSPIDTASNQLAGPPIPIPTLSFGIAITPDGRRAYIANTDGGVVTVVDLQAKQVIGEPISVCLGASSIAITPDGTRAYVACGSDVRVLDIATGQVIGSPIEIEGNPYGMAITPDGRSLYVADSDVDTGDVTVIDTGTNQVVTSIPVSEGTELVAITPDGARAYVTDHEGDQLFTIDTATRQVLGPPMAGIAEPEYIAISPDGRKLFVGQFDPGTVTGLETATNQLIGPIPSGAGVGGLAFVPDQAPVAAFSAPKRVRPGVSASLNGSASTDPDGTVASWAWIFGGGGSATTATATAKHTFKKPGRFAVTLTVTDNEGCSTALVFTGQTVSCNGSPAATVTGTVKVAYPGVRVKCPKSADRPCKFKLKAVAKRRKKKLKAQSAVARATVKPGKKAVVSLKPKKKFAKRLAKAKKTLVQQVVTIDGEQTTKVSKLKIAE